MDFSADGSMLLASCEFSAQLVAVDVKRQRVTRVLRLARFGSMPQDVKLSPDGRTFFVADMARGGIWRIDAHALRVRGFIHTGSGAHGLYPSRDGRDLYITNRAAGSVSVMRFATLRVVATWHIPNSSPDMGGVSADGRTLWLSGRYRSEVYAIDTRTGRLRRTHTRRRGPARTLRLAATRALLPRPYRSPALASTASRRRRANVSASKNSTPDARNGAAPVPMVERSTADPQQSGSVTRCAIVSGSRVILSAKRPPPANRTVDMPPLPGRTQVADPLATQYGE